MSVMAEGDSLVKTMEMVNSNDFRELIQTNAKLLLRYMDPSVELMIHLKSISYLRQRGFSVQDRETTDVKIGRLLDMLQEVPDEECQSVKNGVIDALRESGQDHVADVFCGNMDTVMSDGHYSILKFKKAKLCQFLDLENGLLDELESAEVISSIDVDHVRAVCSDVGNLRSVAIYNEMARKLIETIMRKPDSAFYALISALDKTRQSHVTHILTGIGDSLPLSEECRDKLVEKRSVVVRSIYPKCLVSSLISKGIFSRHDQLCVESRLGENEQSETILDLVARKSQAAFNDFIKTLQECHHGHVVEELMGPEVAAMVKAQVSAGVDRTEVENELRENMQDVFQNNNTEVKQVNDLLASNGISITQVEEGSIIVKFQCRDHAALESLKHIYRSKKLDQFFTEAFLPKFARKGVECLSFSIPDEQFVYAGSKLMTEEHRQALLSSAEWLGDKIAISDELLDKLSLCKRRRQAIERAATREEQVKTLLDIVSRQPDSAFTQLLNALASTHQREAVLYLCKNDETHQNGKNRSEVDDDEAKSSREEIYQFRDEQMKPHPDLETCAESVRDVNYPPEIVKDVAEVENRPFWQRWKERLFQASVFSSFTVRLYKRWKFHPFELDECTGEDMDYDVFLCCSAVDRDPHADDILQQIEEKGYRVCYHERDFMPGQLIIENIDIAIQRSRRTLFFVTDHFLQSSYCLMEFDWAFHHNVTIKGKRRLIVLVMLDRSTDLYTKDASNTAVLRHYLSQYTYIDYTADDWLDKLLYALPLHGLNV